MRFRVMGFFAAGAAASASPDSSLLLRLLLAAAATTFVAPSRVTARRLSRVDASRGSGVVDGSAVTIMMTAFVSLKPSRRGCAARGAHAEYQPQRRGKRPGEAASR